MLWKATGGLKVARASHSAVRLTSGKILVAGGCTGSCLRTDTAAAEVYNPTSGVWTLTGTMKSPRASFGMVLLPNGKVLAAGGCTAQNANGCATVTAAAELYNPATGVWISTGPMHAARSALTATLTPTGLVLVAGGVNAAGDPLRTAELYNPATGKWATTGAMNVARDEHTATALANGKILVAGGEDPAGLSDASTELYDPASGVWSLTGRLHAGRLEHTAVLLHNGKVLVSGGNKVTASTTTVLSSAELYNPATGAWTTTGTMRSPRVGHTSTVLTSGLALDAGGSNNTNELSSAEFYTP
jgi:hypothetical protein